MKKKQKPINMDSVNASLDALILKMKSIKRKILNVGDKVRVTMPVHNLYCRGTIESISGYDIYVRLTYKNILVHRLFNEVFHIVKGKQPITVKVPKEKYAKYR